MRWKPQVRPQLDQLIDVDEAPNIVVLALSEDDLVHLEALPSVTEVPPLVRTGAAPKDMNRQGDDTMCLVDRRVIDVLGQGNGSRPALPATVDQNHLTVLHKNNPTGGRVAHSDWVSEPARRRGVRNARQDDPCVNAVAAIERRRSVLTATDHWGDSSKR
jgi:hypothetical protein